MEAVAARLLARPILQEYDASTVDELAMNPAEFGKLAARHNLVEIAEASRRETCRDRTRLYSIHFQYVCARFCSLDFELQEGKSVQFEGPCSRVSVAEACWVVATIQTIAITGSEYIGPARNAIGPRGPGFMAKQYTTNKTIQAR